MAELTRQSSFERLQKFVGSLSGNQSGSESFTEELRLNAILDIQEWRKKISLLHGVKHGILKVSPDLERIKKVIDNVSHSNNFEVSRGELVSSGFGTSVSAVLSSLPLDPSLKAKNVTARNSRTIITAVMIHFFPEAVLVDGTSEETLTLDTSSEARTCQLAAATLVTSLKKLINIDEKTPLSYFRRVLVGYRFSVRFFMESLDTWKDLDARRMLQALEAPYMECYAIYLSAQDTEDRDHAEIQCRRFRAAVIELLGDRAQTRLEELNAQVEATTVNDTTTATTTTTSKPTAAAAATDAGISGSSTATSNLSPSPKLTTSSSASGFEAAFVKNMKKKTSSSPVASPSRKQTPPAISATTAAAASASSGSSSIFGEEANAEKQGDKATTIETRRQSYHQSLLQRLTSVPVPPQFQEISTVLNRLTKVLPTSSSSSPAPSTISAGDAAERRQIAEGLETMRLVHEVTLDPNYRLPPAPAPGGINLSQFSEYNPHHPTATAESTTRNNHDNEVSDSNSTTITSIPTTSIPPLPSSSLLAGTGNNSNNDNDSNNNSNNSNNNNSISTHSLEALAERVRSTMLMLMRDRFVASLTNPRLTSYNEVREGMRVVVRKVDHYQSEDKGMANNKEASPATVTSTTTAGSSSSSYYLTAQVLAVHRVLLPASEASGPSSIVAPVSTTSRDVDDVNDASCNDHSNTAAPLSAITIATTAPPPASAAATVLVDLSYTYDPQVIERSVPINRLILADEPGDPSVFLSAIDDIHTQLKTLTPNRTDIHTALSASVDRPLLVQMLSHRALSPTDIRSLFQPIVTVISELQAPIRTEAMRDWLQQFFALLDVKFGSTGMADGVAGYDRMLPVLPLFFEFTAACVEEIRRDMANFYLQFLSTKLRHQQLGAIYLSHQLTALAIAGRGLSLDKTASLLHSVVATVEGRAGLRADVEEAVAPAVNGGPTINNSTSSITTVVAPSAPPTPTPANATTATSNTAAAAGAFDLSAIGTEHADEALTFSSRALLAKGFLSLLQLHLRLDSTQASAYVLPETFQWDGRRLARVRDTLDVLSVQCAVSIVIKQFLGKLEIRMLEQEESELLHRLDVLLRDPEIGISSVSVEATRFIKSCVTRASDTNPLRPKTPPPAWEKSFETSLRSAIAEDNPVLQLFTKRLYKVLYRSLLGQPFLGRLPMYSLQAPGLQSNIGILIGLATKLFKHNLVVYRDIYGLVLSSEVFQKSLNEL